MVNKRRTPKSKHKHTYEKCLVEINGFMAPALGERCTICNKIKLKDIFISEKDSCSGFYRMLEADEIYEKYKDLPIVTGYSL